MAVSSLVTLAPSLPGCPPFHPSRPAITRVHPVSTLARHSPALGYRNGQWQEKEKASLTGHENSKLPITGAKRHGKGHRPGKRSA